MTGGGPSPPPVDAAGRRRAHSTGSEAASTTAAAGAAGGGLSPPSPSPPPPAATAASGVRIRSSTTTVTGGGMPRSSSRPNFSFDPAAFEKVAVPGAAAGVGGGGARRGSHGAAGVSTSNTTAATATTTAMGANPFPPETTVSSGNVNASNWSTASTAFSDEDVGRSFFAGDHHGLRALHSVASVVDALSWAPDKGRGREHAERERALRPSLVEGGVRAGESRVVFAGGWRLQLHAWVRDFFISALNTPLPALLVCVAAIYLLMFFVFAGIWWLIWLANPRCLSKSTDSGFSFGTAFIFAVATTQTVGYGNTAPNDGCPPGYIVLVVQVLIALVTEAVVLGVVFARISRPHQRASTIGISQVAVVARRDGVLKFMFRVTDLRATVVEPHVKAYLYTWGAGRTTAEGEHVPVRCEELQIGYIDGALLLPLIIEHTVDERSPLCGHSHDTLLESGAEIVVTFHGTTEFGNPFAARRSYLPHDILWGHQFKKMIKSPAPGQTRDTRYVVDVSKLHDVEPQSGLATLPPAALSRTVVGRSARCVPYPLLGENTLCLSDSLCLSRTRSGQVALMVRVGDTYPNQHLEVCAKAYLYRWRPQGAASGGIGGIGGGGGGGGRGSRGSGGVLLNGGGGGADDGETSLPASSAGRESSASVATTTAAAASRHQRDGRASRGSSLGGVEAPPAFSVGEPDDFECLPLDVGYNAGSDRLMLWLPIVVKHVIDERSPLWHWATGRGGGMLRDADASIAVTVEGYRYSTSANAMRTRIYSVMRDVRRDHGFCSIVTSPSESADLKPRVNWAAFHETVKLSGEETGYGGYGGGGGGVRGVSFARPPAAPPAPPPPPPPPSAAAAPIQQQKQQHQAARISNNLHRNSMDVLRSDAARHAAGSGASAAAPSAAAAATAPPPSSAAAQPPSAAAASFAAAAAAAAAATAAATRAPPPEAGGGMLLPPNLDPDSTFRLRTATAQARARLDVESLFDAAREADAAARGETSNPVSLSARRLSSSSPKTSEGREDVV